ncbi:unnamed protein product [Parascedosporium putredinis]|uniref:DUF8021 domain-containing protein n=1 Tax=Parascedosporium putredinis TaxID=1442378 RepID=A0A9P1MD40_9PEZI|nr:unnamed protein product [Parascedosporium putredinis]CAI8001888.1 unnamed protein product [Parascedosporium putredinis]
MRALALATCAAGLAHAARPTPKRQDAACTREFLTDATTTYLAAQAAGDAAGVLALASDALVYTENFKPADAAAGILATALVVDHDFSLLDTTQCATFTELDGVVAKMESIITTTGDWLFNAADTLKYASAEDWSEIPEAERAERDVIQAAGDAYCDIFMDKTTEVPWGQPCARLEGGAYTGRGQPTDSCSVGIPDNVPLVNRRYVIDEVFGSVDIFMDFNGENGIPDSHMFRVESGKLRFVHTITNMSRL